MGKVDPIDASGLVLPNGSVPTSYKWQLSTNTIDWTDIAGATGSSYHPIGQKRGTVYYRVVMNNAMGSHTSEQIKIRVRSCQLPVNHNISVMGYD